MIPGIFTYGTNTYRHSFRSVGILGVCRNGYDDDVDDDDDDDSKLSARQACRVCLIVLGMGPRHGLPYMGQLESMQAMPHHLLRRPPPVNASKN